jgi:hypothetical protein
VSLRIEFSWHRLVWLCGLLWRLQWTYSRKPRALSSRIFVLILTWQLLRSPLNDLCPAQHFQHWSTQNFCEQTLYEDEQLWQDKPAALGSTWVGQWTRVVTAKQDRLDGGTALITSIVGLLICREHDVSQSLSGAIMRTEYSELWTVQTSGTKSVR